MAVLLGSGVRGRPVAELAREALRCLDAARSANLVEELAAIRGIGRAKACAIAAALEMGRRRFRPGRRITGPSDAYEAMRHYADRDREHFLCLSLNGAHEAIALRVVSVGLANRSLVHPREVFAEPIVDRACAVIVGHNHPSGRLDPSPEDFEVTKRLMEAGSILGIGLLDHVILGRDGYRSLKEEGLVR